LDRFRIKSNYSIWSEILNIRTTLCTNNKKCQYTQNWKSTDIRFISARNWNLYISIIVPVITITTAAVAKINNYGAITRLTTSTSRHWSQTMTTFCLINVSGRSTYSSVHCRRQSVSCRSHSSVEQSSMVRHCCPLSLHLLLSS